MGYADDRFFTVTLPWPPSQNQSLKARVSKVTGKPLFYDDKGVKNWRAEATKILAEVSGLHSVFMDEPVEVHLSLYPPSNRSDTDGVEKKVLDVLQGVAYHNDRQVYGRRSERTIETHGTDAKIVVRVWLFGTPWPLGYDLSPNR